MRYLAAIAGLLLGIAGIFALRDATLSTHERMKPGSQLELVMDVRTHGGEHGQTVAEMSSAILLNCRLEVSSDPVGQMNDLGNGRFRAVLTPALDTTDRRQFRGCLEDWTLDQVRVDVVRLDELGEP
jgi:hypothetical protein